MEEVKLLRTGIIARTTGFRMVQDKVINFLAPEFN